MPSFKKANLFQLALILVMIAPASVFAGIIHVPADQPTIQAGIDAAVTGDTVLVADGTYTGSGNRDIDFHGKGIVLKSESGRAATIIDCQGDSLNPHRGFYFHSGEDSTAIVNGFTIQGGYGLFDSFAGSSAGGGIKCDSSSAPKIINNTISGNSAGQWGGGMFCSNNSSPTIENNLITGNSAKLGGGFYCLNSNSIISNNTFTGNSAGQWGGAINCQESNLTLIGNFVSGNSAISGGGIRCVISTSIIMTDNIISRNSATKGGGFACGLSSATMSNNTIIGNIADSGSGVYLIAASLSLENSIVAFNNGDEPIVCTDPAKSLSLICCDVYGNSGGDWVGCIADQAEMNGNFSLDPFLCDTTAGDYHLSEFSPCLASPPSNTCKVLVGALGLGCASSYICADANGDSLVTFDDLTFLRSYYFECGTLPFPLAASDLNCDGTVDIGDIAYLAQYLNGTGPAPCCLQ